MNEEAPVPPPADGPDVADASTANGTKTSPPEATAQPDGPLLTHVMEPGSSPTNGKIKLTFINRSNDENNSDILIFSKNVATSFDEIAVAWQVIRNCGQGWSHPVEYPAAVTVGVMDAYGNYSPQMQAENGQAFAVVRRASGDALVLSGQSSSPQEISIANDLPLGAISAIVFRDGKPYAMKQTVAPQQKAVFQFKPTIFIGVVSQVEEGQILNSAIISDINTEISLLGIASADIVMSGGGPGPQSTPFTFVLENVVMA